LDGGSCVYAPGHVWGGMAPEGNGYGRGEEKKALNIEGGSWWLGYVTSRLPAKVVTLVKASESYTYSSTAVFSHLKGNKNPVLLTLLNSISYVKLSCKYLISQNRSHYNESIDTKDFYLKNLIQVNHELIYFLN
jgi:hypothetical protein